MIIDAHHHLWQRRAATTTGSTRSPIRRWRRSSATSAGGLPDACRCQGVTGSVLVQAAQTVAETRWLLAQARASNGLIRGVVGWIDMAAPDAPEALQRLAQDPLLRGIRPMLQDIAATDWVLHPRLDAAFRALIDLDLAFDVLIRPPHLESCLTLLMRYPHLRAIIDHCAKPHIAQRRWQPWADGMRRIARRDVGVLQAVRSGHRGGPGLEDRRSAPLYRSPHRMLRPAAGGVGQRLAGADLNADYGQWLDATKQLISSLAPADQAGIPGSECRALLSIRRRYARLTYLR